MARLIVRSAALALAFAGPANAGVLRRWDAYVAEASARFAVPPDWIWDVIAVESAGRTMRGGVPITSSAGAMGLMQLMPGTWREMRALHGLGADPHEPRDNILAGTAYLRAMYERFGYPGMFAAYNAGPRRYAAYLAGRAALPAETRTYVRRVAGVVASRPRLATASPERARAAPALFAVGQANGREPRLDSTGADPLFAIRRMSAE